MKRQFSLWLLLMVLSSAYAVQADSSSKQDSNHDLFCAVAEDNGEKETSDSSAEDEEPECG